MRSKNEDKYREFMYESNGIEGENRLNPGDLKAVKFALIGFQSLDEILEMHGILGKHLNAPWVGKLRDCDVWVAKQKCPDCVEVPKLVREFMKRLPRLQSWEAHNEFEMIHPFQDLNGRMGRLIWLSKAIHEGYKFGIPFLQAYYYQTLGRFGDGRIGIRST